MNYTVVLSGILLAGSTLHAAPIEPLIESFTITKTTLTVVANKNIEYVSRTFFAEYNAIDLQQLDSSLVLTPFILAVAPIVWVSGKQYTVQAMDADIADSLTKIKPVFQRFYPSLDWSGEIIPMALTNHKKKTLPTAPIGVLFSGGVDSVATSFAHHHQKQLLITVWGSDIAADDTAKWQRAKMHSQEFAQTYHHDLQWVRSNFLEFFDNKKLSSLTPAIPDWWGYTGQALGYTGLAFPISYANNCSSLLIASTHTKEYQYPAGTHPDIDNNIKCGGIPVIHDLYDMTRQQKIALIIEHTKTLPKPFLRVCWSGANDKANCQHCVSKCLQTANALLVEGANPKDYGFDMSLQEILWKTRNYLSLPAGGLKLTYGTVDRLKQINKRFIERHESFMDDDILYNYFAWLMVRDLDQYAPRNQTHCTKIQ